MSDIKFDKVQDGELFKFDEVGKVIKGVLVDFHTQETNKGDGNVYEVKTKEGTVAFFAPTMLHKKLKTVTIPSIVEITYKELTQTKAGNDLKLFDVGVAPASEENMKLLGISIPTEEVGEDF